MDFVDPDFMPGAIKITSDPSSGDIVEIDGEPYSSWLPRHFDHCYNNELNRAGVLRAVEITPNGGQTCLFDCIELCRRLPEYLRARIEGDEGREGNALLEAVARQIIAISEAGAYVHDWTETNMLIWDNWRMLDRVTGCTPPHRWLDFRRRWQGNRDLEVHLARMGDDLELIGLADAFGAHSDRLEVGRQEIGVWNFHRNVARLLGAEDSAA